MFVDALLGHGHHSELQISYSVDVADCCVLVQWPQCKEAEGNLTHSLMGIVRGEFQNKTLNGFPSVLLPLLEVLISILAFVCWVLLSLHFNATHTRSSSSATVYFRTTHHSITAMFVAAPRYTTNTLPEPNKYLQLLQQSAVPRCVWLCAECGPVSYTHLTLPTTPYV